MVNGDQQTLLPLGCDTALRPPDFTLRVRCGGGLYARGHSRTSGPFGPTAAWVYSLFVRRGESQYVFFFGGVILAFVLGKQTFEGLKGFGLFALLTCSG